MTQHHRKYGKPPIEEALCEFRFKPDQDWDFTVPGRLYTKLEKEYPGKPRNQKAAAIGLDIQEGSPLNIKYNEGLARVELLSEDGRRMVGVRPDALTVHILKPYQYAELEVDGWEGFKSRILVALSAYWEVTEPKGIYQVGIRYINKIIIPEKEADIKEYLQMALPSVKELPKKLTRFMSQVEYDYEDDVRLILSQGYASVSQEHNRELLLDLDVIWSPPEPVRQEKALEMVNDLHLRETIAFEAIITDKTRELFNV